MKLFNTLSDAQTENAVEEQALTSTAPVRRGPPNRMNDLPYREWMKFQKSFFRHSSNQLLVEECIYFFTKALWEDGTESRSLIAGVKDFKPSHIPPPRDLEIIAEVSSTKDLASHLHRLEMVGNQFDFVLLDLRDIVPDKAALSQFLSEDADKLFLSLRKILVPKRYCGLLVGMETEGGGGFPLPWSVALASREYLKLRDEKIGLVGDEGRVFYCLFMQAEDDGRATAILTPSQLKMAEQPVNVPAWVIPKPPPRKKNEVLHPAKYPETLVSEFIHLFTKPGDTVFDPMVGTGSTVVAALQAMRNGLGTDLSHKFAEIARKRAAEASAPALFEEMRPVGNILQGDAAQLDKIHALDGIRFDYCVTSPPYWSMLSNPGSENQETRRKKNLPLVYSEHKHDLGNVEDYDEFLSLLEHVYAQVADRLVDDGYMTVVVKNVKRNHTLYPLAWDLTMRLCSESGGYEYAGTTLWCQDDVGLKPFAVGIHWVSNILHHYCLHFRKRASAHRHDA